MGAAELGPRLGGRQALLSFLAGVWAGAVALALAQLARGAWGARDVLGFGLLVLLFTALVVPALVLYRRWVAHYADEA